MLRIGNKWLAELDTTPLVHLNLQKRRHKRGAKLPWRWIILVALYLIAVVKIARKSAKPSNIWNILTGPLLWLANGGAIR
jgi:hypothetical protein